MAARIRTPEAVTPLTPGQPAAVTQQMLAEFVEISRLTRRRDELRDLILGLLEAGRPVEAGPLTADVRRGEMHKLTASGLKAVIGEENFLTFLAEIPPVAFRWLVVSEKGWGATGRSRERRG